MITTKAAVTHLLLVRLWHLILIPAIICVLALQASCSTASQPDWAAQHVLAKHESTIEKRSFRFRPFRKQDSRLGLTMVEVEDDGALVLRSRFGFETLQPGTEVLFMGNYLKLLESDPSTQTAIVQSWPKSIYQ